MRRHREQDLYPVIIKYDGAIWQSVKDKKFAQSAVAMLPAAAMITIVDWGVVACTEALAAVASLLTSLTGLPEVRAWEEE